MKTVIKLVFGALFLTGCATLPGSWMYSGNNPYPPVLEYYGWVKSLSVDEARQARENIQKQQEIDPVFHRVQLALLTSIPPGSTSEDEDLAISYLGKAIAASDEAAPGIKLEYQQLAALWLDVLVHRQKQRRLIGDLQTSKNELQKQEQSMRERNAVLLEQINALKSIEKQINMREINNNGKP